MQKTCEIDYESLSDEEKNALMRIESGRSIDEPTAIDVIKNKFDGNAKNYLLAMGEIQFRKEHSKKTGIK